MAWPDGVNFNAETNVGNYSTFIMFWKAIRERSWALAKASFPERVNVPWSFGTVTGMTLTTLTDSAQTWEPGRWTHDNPAVPWSPSSYDVLIDYDNLDHSKHVRARITGNTATELTISSIEDYVTGGWIASAGSLVGKSYKIIKRGGLGWGDRWPRTPNDREAWNTTRGGSAAAVSVIAGEITPDADYSGKRLKKGAIETLIKEVRADGTLIVDWIPTSISGAYDIITDAYTVIATGSATSTVDGLWRSESDFPSGALAGKDLLIYGAKLERISISSNDFRLISFAKRSTPYNGNSFSIVAAGGRAWPGQTPDYPGRWYAGVTAPFYTVRPSDLLFRDVTTVQMPVATLQWEVGTPPFCEVATHNVFDVDAWSEADEECSEADDAKAPDFWKTLRALQIWIEQNCEGFVPVNDYSGATAIPSYTPATLFRDIGAGYVGTYTATADGDGNYTFTGIDTTEPYHWTILNPDGSVRSKGERSGTTFEVDDSEPDETFSLVVAKGWPRAYAREFQHAYPRSAFIPDIQTTDFGSSEVDPPTDEYPGMWIDRDPSTVYAESDGYGFTQDIGPAFIDGTRARYRGDNWSDPAVVPHTESDGDPLVEFYYRNLWLGRFSVERREIYEAMKFGAITYGGRKWFKQTAADWWGYPIGIGELLIHAGNATAGTTTTLSDTSQNWIPPEAVDPEIVPFWTDNRHVGFLLEVVKSVNDVNGDPQNVLYRTPITSQTDYVVTFTAVPAFTIPATDTTAQIDAPALDVNLGDAYRIRTPYRRNWFAGRTVVISKPGESDQTRTVTYHDDSHLWFDSALPFDIDDTCEFRIEELSPGHVYKWSAAGSKWVPVTGTTHEPNELLPATVAKHGRMMKGDYLEPVFKSLYNALNKLVWTRGEVAWTAEDPTLPGVPGWTNVGRFSVTDASDPPTSDGKWDAFLDAYETTGLGGTGEYLDEAPEYSTLGALAPTASQLIATVRFAFSSINPPDFGGLARAVDVFSFSTINALDSDPGETFSETVIGAGPNTSVTYSRFDFDPHGLPLLHRAYSKLLTFGASTDDKFLGGMTPTDPAAYVAPVDKPHEYGFSAPNDLGGTEYFSGSAFMGFRIRDSVAIIKWNVAGGFEYCLSPLGPLVYFGGLFAEDTPTAMDGSAE